MGFANQCVVALGHDIVIILNDHVTLNAVLKKDVQMLANPLDLDVLGRSIFVLADFLQLVLGTGLRLDAQNLPPTTLPL